MENAVVVFETAIKDIGAKLDTITWKLESYEKGFLTCLRQNSSGQNASVMELMQNISDIKNDFYLLSVQAMNVEENNREVKTNLTESINSTYNNYSELKDLLKQHEYH